MSFHLCDISIRGSPKKKPKTNANGKEIAPQRDGGEQGQSGLRKRRSNAGESPVCPHDLGSWQAPSISVNTFPTLPSSLQATAKVETIGQRQVLRLHLMARGSHRSESKQVFIDYIRQRWQLNIWRNSLSTHSIVSTFLIWWFPGVCPGDEQVSLYRCRLSVCVRESERETEKRRKAQWGRWPGFKSQKC